MRRPGVVVIPWVKRSVCAREGSKHCMPPQSKAPQRSCPGVVFGWKPPTQVRSNWIEINHCARKSWRKTYAVWFRVYGNLGKEDTIWFEEWENENLLDSFWGSSAICQSATHYLTLLDVGIMIASNLRALRILLFASDPLLPAFQHPSSILSSLENEDLFLIVHSHVSSFGMSLTYASWTEFS